MSDPALAATTRRLLLRRQEQITPEQAATLEKELRASLRRQHEWANQCDLIRDPVDLEVDDAGYWIIETPADVADLEQLRTTAPLETGVVATLGVQLCNALLHASYPASGNAYPHGSLRPACLFVADQWLTVSDFGIAPVLSRVLFREAGVEELDGMAPYVSRELWLEQTGYGELKDIFAVGVILYELATGHHPYDVDRTDISSCQHRILTGQHRPAAQRNSKIDPTLAKILDRAVSRNEAARFPGISALRDALTPLAPPDPVDAAVQAAQTVQADSVQALESQLRAIDAMAASRAGRRHAHKLSAARTTLVDKLNALRLKLRIEDATQRFQQALQLERFDEAGQAAESIRDVDPGKARGREEAIDAARCEAQQRDEQRRRDAERTKAQRWVQMFEEKWKAEKWEESQSLLDNAPEFPEYLAEFTGRVEQFRVQVQQVAAARDWLATFARWIESADLANAKICSNAEPALATWPSQLAKQRAELRSKLAALTDRAAQHATAHEWIARVVAALDKKEFEAAAQLLGKAPPITQWPDEVIQQRDQARARLDEFRRAEAELVEWFARAQAAAKTQEWDRALEILDKPPPAWERASPGLRREVEATRKSYVDRREASIQQARQAAVDREVTSRVHDLLSTEFTGLIETSVIDCQVSELVFADAANADGRGRVRVSLRPAFSDLACPPFETEFEFRFEGPEPRLTDVEAKLRKPLAIHLRKHMEQWRKARLDKVAKSLGPLFPKARVEASYLGGAARVDATIHLTEGASDDQRIPVHLAWDPAKLTWAIHDRTNFTFAALKAALAAMQSAANHALFEGSPVLSEYRPWLTIEVENPILTSAGSLPSSLRTSCRLSLKAGPAREKQQLVCMLPVTFRALGQIEFSAGIQAAESSLERLILVAQNNSISENERKSEAVNPDRIQVTGVPRKLKQRAVDVKFEVKSRLTGNSFHLPGIWDMNKMAFDLPADAVKQITKFVEREEKGKWFLVLGWRGVLLGAIVLLAIVSFVAIFVGIGKPNGVPAWEADLANIRSIWNSREADKSETLDTTLTKFLEDHEDNASPSAMDDVRDYQVRLEKHRDNFELARRLVGEVESPLIPAGIPGCFPEIQKRVGEGGKHAGLAVEAWPTVQAEKLKKSVEKLESILSVDVNQKPDALVSAAALLAVLDTPHSTIRRLIRDCMHETFREWNNEIETRWNSAQHLDAGALFEAMKQGSAELRRYNEKAPHLELSQDSLTELGAWKDKTDQWQKSLLEYRGQISVAGADIPKKMPQASAGVDASIEALSKAREAWPTDFASAQLKAMRHLRIALTTADTARDRGEWRSVLQTLAEAPRPGNIGGPASQVDEILDSLAQDIQTAVATKLNENAVSVRQGFDSREHSLLNDLLKDARALNEDAEYLAEKAPDLKEQLKEVRADSKDWFANLQKYDAQLNFQSDPKPDQLQTVLNRVAAARASWKTSYVEKLWSEIDPLTKLLNQSRESAETDWRKAYFLHQRFRTSIEAVSAKVQDAALQGVLLAIPRAELDRLRDTRQLALTAIRDKACKWVKALPAPLTIENAPAEFGRRLQDAVQARGYLDQLDVVFADKHFKLDDPTNSLWDNDADCLKELGRRTTLEVALTDGAAGPLMTFVVIPQDQQKTLPALWMGQTELTVEQFHAVVAAGLAPDGNAKRLPKANISANDAKGFCAKLREKGLKARLPTDKEWLHAATANAMDADPLIRLCRGQPGLCRLDASDKWELDPMKANFRSNEAGGRLAPPHRDDARESIQPGKYPPSGWLLFDMFGNLAELAEEGSVNTGRFRLLGASYDDRHGKVESEGVHAYGQAVGADETDVRQGVRIVIELADR